MPLENFYRETDRNERRWRTKAAYVFIAVYLLTIGYFALRPAGSALFFENGPHFDQFCRTLPVPPGSALTAQTSSISAFASSAFLTFRTDDRAAVDLFYLAWAEANGFSLQPTDENAGARLSFRSESKQMLVELIDYSATEYVVRCAEEAPESEH